LTNELTMKRSAFIIFFLFFMFQISVGGDFRYLRTNEGLYNSEINSIAQDRSGKMWFATWTGLTSYNGYEFQFFKPELGKANSLPDKKVNEIFIDSKDNLWIASLSGVSKFMKKTNTFQIVALEGLSNTNYYVFGFFESSGNVIVHTNEGLFLIYPKSNTPSGFKAKKLKYYKDGTEVLEYIHLVSSCDAGLVLVSNTDPNNPTRIFLSECIANGTDTLIRVSKQIDCRFTINAISQPKGDNTLYLGTDNGISVLSMATSEIKNQVHFKGMNIQGMFYATDHRIYCYSFDPVLMYIDRKTSQTGQYHPDPLKFGSLLDNSIMCLFEDFSGNLWVGHQGLGLSIMNLHRKAFNSFQRDPSNPKSLNGNIVMCFEGTDKEIFVGLRRGGLCLTSKQLKKDEHPEFKVLPYRQQPKPDSGFDNIWDIARESDSVFWVASDGGLDRLRKTKKGWIYGNPDEPPLYLGVVRKILIDKDKNVWCGTFSEGLKFFSAQRRNTTRKSYDYPYDASNPEGISDISVLSMLIDSQNRFWVGTINGLNLVKTKYNELDLSGSVKPDIRFKRYIAYEPVKDYLNANEINCICENSDGQIWLATQGGGINILDPETDKFTHIDTESGLSGNDVVGILSDQSGVKWISTNGGLNSFNPENKIKPFTHYNHTDGIQGETFKVNSYYHAVDGEMFFGGDNGFTRFYPSQIQLNPIAPRIGLTNLRISNKIVNIGDTLSHRNLMTKSLDLMEEIVLPFSKNSFSIGVGIHHYQFPEGNMIRYKLDGFNDRWITMSATVQNIYFSKLPHGKYTLHISGLSADNVEAEAERLLEIRILPPWYKTWYIRTGFLLVFGFVVGIIFYLMASRQKLAFQKKIDAISSENNENKMRFLANIAHELRTPLSLVIAPIEDMTKNYTSIDPQWKNHLNLIYRNSNYLLTLINQIIDFRKLNAGKLQLNLHETDIVSLVKDVVGNFKGLERRRKTNLHIHVPDQAILVEIDSQKIEEVLYNLLSNAFKHTSETHAIEVSMQMLSGNKEYFDGKDIVRISVFNEGKDISDEDKVKIFERFYKVSEKVEGAGIGLSFSKSLIEMHGGTITVESHQDLGVAFHVDLPFDHVEVTSVVNEQSASDLLWHEDVYDSAQVYELENKGKDLTIVIVEDNIDLRTFLRGSLSPVYNCFEAGDGKEGYELITRMLPDIVISDVVMPKMDGYELCEKVKQNVKTCHIPIILLTANNSSDHIVAGYTKGADVYVIKPFDMTIIKSQIARLIKNRELIREKYMTQNFMVEISSSNVSKDDEFIVKLRQLLEQNLSVTDFNVKKLSEDLNISTTHLYRKLKALTGLSPVEFIRVFKLQKACEMLSNTNLSVKEIGYGLGFNNLSYFVKCFREQFDITPSVYRQKGLPDQSGNDITNQSGVS
jgi:signal transduction histidine kinase/ligand-binding sensor domain-containing protein/DNA-binding response OmpR family regulator